MTTCEQMNDTALVEEIERMVMARLKDRKFLSSRDALLSILYEIEQHHHGITHFAFNDMMVAKGLKRDFFLCAPEAKPFLGNDHGRVRPDGMADSERSKSDDAS